MWSDLRKLSLIFFGSCILWFILAISDPENLFFTVLFFISLFAGGVLLYIGEQRARAVPAPVANKDNADAEKTEKGGTAVIGKTSAGNARLAQDEVINKRYRILKKLKTGGMSVIYLADDLAMKDKCVLKVPRYDTVHDPDINVEKLNVEAGFLKKLNYPNIVGYRDMFNHDNVPHLVMDYIEGDDLFTVVSRSPVDEKKAARWGDQILGALEYIHSFNLVHRDVNPWNMMVNPKCDVVIIDFGTVKAAAVDGATVVTKSGFEIPEQVSRGYSDERSDIYGAGSVLFYVLTGTPPGLVMKRDLSQMMVENHGVSRKFARCIDQSLQLEAEKRFHTAKAMRTALKSVDESLSSQK